MKFARQIVGALAALCLCISTFPIANAQDGGGCRQITMRDFPIGVVVVDPLDATLVGTVTGLGGLNLSQRVEIFRHYQSGRDRRACRANSSLGLSELVIDWTFANATSKQQLLSISVECVAKDANTNYLTSVKFGAEVPVLDPGLSYEYRARRTIVARIADGRGPTAQELRAVYSAECKVAPIFGPPKS